MKNEIKHTAHSTYRCEYHIVFAPKYRRKEIYGQLKKDIGEIIRKLCNEKKVEIIEAEACSDHIHMLVSVPPYISIAQFMGFLKGKSTLMIFDRHANLKYKYGSRNFWCRGYYVDTFTYLYGHSLIAYASLLLCLLIFYPKAKRMSFMNFGVMSLFFAIYLAIIGLLGVCKNFRAFTSKAL